MFSFYELYEVDEGGYLSYTTTSQQVANFVVKYFKATELCNLFINEKEHCLLHFKFIVVLMQELQTSDMVTILKTLHLGASLHSNFST